jgi:hypothetical protein
LNIFAGQSRESFYGAVIAEDWISSGSAAVFRQKKLGNAIWNHLLQVCWGQFTIQPAETSELAASLQLRGFLCAH